MKQKHQQNSKNTVKLDYQYCNKKTLLKEEKEQKT